MKSLVILLLVVSGSSGACERPEPRFHTPMFDWQTGVNLNVGAIPIDRRPALQRAVDQWASAFRSLGCTMPPMSLTGSGCTDPNGNGCVRVTIGPLDRPPEIGWSGDTPVIDVQFAQTTAHEIRFTDLHFIADEVPAHEIGHLLGLMDANEFSDVMNQDPFQQLAPAQRDARASARAFHRCGY